MLSTSYILSHFRSLFLLLSLSSTCLILSSTRLLVNFEMPRKNPSSSYSATINDNLDTTPTTAIPQSLHLPKTFTDGGALPKLFVFDLDYTLWPFWVDTHITPPLKAMEGGAKVKDRYGEGFGFYKEVGVILVAAREKGIKIGIASRTSAPELAREMLKLLRIPTEPPILSSSSNKRSSGSSSSSVKPLELLDNLQIYPGSKITHFKRIYEWSKGEIPYEEMLFFDDESRNRDTESLGVTMRLVRDGVTRNEIDEGVREWRKRNKRT